MFELVFIRVPVIEHFAHQTIGHGITRSTGELVKHLLMVHNSDINAVNRPVHVGQTVGLFHVQFSGYNQHIGNRQSMQILILDILIRRNLL